MSEVIEAARLHNWYAFAALLLTLVIQIVRKAPALRNAWNKIPEGYRFLVPLLSGAAIGFTQSFAAGEGLADAMFASVGGALGIGLTSMGAAAALKESPLPWDGGAGGKPKPPKDRIGPTGPSSIGLAVFVILGLATLLSCAGARAEPCNEADMAVFAAQCRARVELECKDVPDSECPAIDECDAEVDKRCGVAK